jgi:hypothetical protein
MRIHYVKFSRLFIVISCLLLLLVVSDIQAAIKKVTPKVNLTQKVNRNNT